MSIKIALAGNPNCGKTTLFNQLTGSSQYVGNWPGVTVEKKEGKLKGHKDVIIQDLPGIYSLSPYTLEEVVARGYLVNERPDAILNIVDGTNIERNLYLTTQLLELGIPVVIAINMMDIVRKNGDKINVKKLSETLGCEIIEISALKGEGGFEAAQKAVEAAEKKQDATPLHVFTGSVEHAIAHIEESVEMTVDHRYLRWFAMKLFERDEEAVKDLNIPADVKAHIEQHIVDCENEMDDDAESIITNQRYAYISKVCDQSVSKKAEVHNLTISDKIDRIVTNRILALPIFAGIMFLIYWISVTTIGGIVTDFTNDTLFGEWICGNLGPALESIGCADWLVGLINDGIVGGVGAVLGFVPQMLVLFFMLSILEQIGYMARVAFILDRIFRRFGLSGKSFIPMLIGSGCGVPGVMASRTIENEKRSSYDNYDHLLYSLWSKNADHRSLCRCIIRWFRTGCSFRLLHRCSSNRYLRYHAEKDKTICRRSSTIRYGASGLPYSNCRFRFTCYMGAWMVLHQTCRYCYRSFFRSSLVLTGIWFRRWCIWHGGRQ